MKTCPVCKKEKLLIKIPIIIKNPKNITKELISKYYVATDEEQIKIDDEIYIQAEICNDCYEAIRFGIKI